VPVDGIGIGGSHQGADSKDDAAQGGNDAGNPGSKDDNQVGKRGAPHHAKDFSNLQPGSNGTLDCQPAHCSGHQEHQQNAVQDHDSGKAKGGNDDDCLGTLTAAIADGDDDQQQGDNEQEDRNHVHQPHHKGFQPVHKLLTKFQVGQAALRGIPPCHAAGDFQQPASGDNLPYKGDQLDGGEDQDFLDPIGILEYIRKCQFKFHDVCSF